LEPTKLTIRPSAGSNDGQQFPKTAKKRRQALEIHHCSRQAALDCHVARVCSWNCVNGLNDFTSRLPL
jgi:hypothetical protein